MCHIQRDTSAVIRKACCGGCPSSVLDARYRRIPYKTPYAFREEARLRVCGPSRSLLITECAPDCISPQHLALAILAAPRRLLQPVGLDRVWGVAGTNVSVQ